MGIHSIGYVMICFGVVNAICSIIFGSAMKYIGRIPILALGKCQKTSLGHRIKKWRTNIMVSVRTVSHLQEQLCMVQSSLLCFSGGRIPKTQPSSLALLAYGVSNGHFTCFTYFGVLRVQPNSRIQNHLAHSNSIVALLTWLIALWLYPAFLFAQVLATLCGKHRSTVCTASYSDVTKRRPSPIIASGSQLASWSLTLIPPRCAHAWSCTCC